MLNREQMVQLSMLMILEAGNAQNLIQDALREIEELKYVDADDLLKSADEHLIKAHQHQTEIIQKEADDENVEYLALFSHAQDTLMSVKSEYRITISLMSLVKTINDRMNQLEERR